MDVPTFGALWSEWSLPDWFSVIGFPLAILGLAITLVQLRRTRRSADAAALAVAEVQRRLADNHLLLLVPELSKAESELDRSISQGDHERCRLHLSEWRQKANRIRVLLERKGEHEDLRAQIRAAVPHVHAARVALNDHTRTPEESTKLIRKRIERVGDLADAIVTEKMAFVEDPQ